MGGSLQIGKIFGIPFRIHASWLVIFVLITWSLSTSLFPELYEGWSTSTYWFVGIVSSLLLFVSVLLHELSHSLLAIARGHRVRSITLFILGGVSEIEDEARKPGEEFWIAFVGPLSSLVLAGVFFGLRFTVKGWNEQADALFWYLGFVNTLVGVFNLIPGYPMDGGRVLRSILWRTTGSLSKATQAAARVGMAVGFGMIGVGLFLVFFQGDVSGIWLAFVGWFIASAASSSRRQDTIRTRLSGYMVRDAMRQGFPSIPPGLSIQELLDNHISKTYDRAYIVMYGDTVYGLVTATDVALTPAQDRRNKYVTEIMTRIGEVAAVSPNDPLEAAMQSMVQHDVQQVVVMEDGKPLGMVSREDLVRMLEMSGVMGTRQPG